MIPVIDFSKPIHSLIKPIDMACREFGVFLAKNTLISQKVLDNCLLVCKEFHRLDLETKLKYHIRHSDGARGYYPCDNLDPDKQSQKTRVKRIYSSYEVGSEDNQVTDSNILMCDNHWPKEIELFKQYVESYWVSVKSFGDIISRILSISIGLDEHYFLKRSNNPCSSLRLLHYPKNNLAEQRPGLDSHTDYECFSILYQASRGLQILNRSGIWIDVPFKEGEYIVLLGDTMEVLTNTVYESVLHQVLNTQEERFSLAYFYGLDYDVQIDPIPKFVEESMQDRLNSFVFGKHLEESIRRNYWHLDTGSQEQKESAGNPFKETKLRRIARRY